MSDLAKFDPVSSARIIAYPSDGHSSEFEVQAALYSALRELGIDVRGEVKFYGDFGLRDAKASCRFDLVIFRDKNPELIIEVKARLKGHRNGIEATRQFQRYTGFGVPVWFVYGMEGARLAIDELKERWSEPRQREKSRLQGA